MLEQLSEIGVLQVQAVQVILVDRELSVCRQF